MRQRVAVLCPGRASYTATQLGSLSGIDEAPRASELAELIERTDRRRLDVGDPGVREMDGAERFSASFLAGHNAAPLIFSVSAYQFLKLDRDKVDLVAIGGNSMGWYSALACAGALSLSEGMRLVETMGGMTREGEIGGQLMYPVVDAGWRPSADRAQRVARALAKVAERAQCGYSIRFGGFEVLWGEDAALQPLSAALPAIRFGEQEYPLNLFGNSAFHSPSMAEVSGRGNEALADLAWRSPRVPLIDGRGDQWRPVTATVGDLAHYTLGHQVVETFDFTAAVRTILHEYAPDRLVLLGPGESLGGAVAHVLIREAWHGIRDRESFLESQRRDPFLISLDRPDQAALVT